MKNYLAMSALLASVAFLGGNAQAADAVADYAHDWSGFYAGVHAGFGNANLNGNFDGDPEDQFVDTGEGAFELEPQNFLLGGQVGYNHQLDQFVIGVEGDLAWADWSDSIKYGDEDDEVSAEMNWLGTIRARAGVTVGDLLVFATAGVAWTDMSYTATDDYTGPDPDEIGTVDFSDMGWAFGGGAAYALNEHFSVKADVLFITFNDEIDTSDLVPSDSDDVDFVELENMFVARAGINYNF
jgi:outer membrane immunogenic protein